MSRSRVEVLDPLLPEAEARRILELCERFGSYGSYAEEATNAVAFAPALPQRFDAALNFVRSGGRFARREEPRMLAVRTNYFRETYAYGDTRFPGVDRLLWHEGLLEAARKVHDRPVIEPNIVYANMLVPGQELALHTDVPEFRGANRKRFPQWLLVVMHHSGLFDAWRMPIATGIGYFARLEAGACRGGALAYYPDGPAGAPATFPARHDTAIVLDTDSVFHGVDRVAETRPLPPLRPGMRLAFVPPARDAAAGRWRVGPPDGPALAEYGWDEVRFSVSWKAYCFADAAEQRAAAEHSDDLALPFILDTLVADLRRRDRLGSAVPAEEELAQRLVEEYVRFPAPEPGPIA
jgi:hypothetical protein